MAFDKDAASEVRALSDADPAQHQSGTHHIRELTGLISRHEKPILVFLAQRVPQQVLPDHLTGIGLAGAGLTFVGLVLSHLGAAWLLLAAAGLIVNWLGDSLDGTVARERGIERPQYGFFVDHMTDVAAQCLIVLGLGLSPYMRLDVACLILTAYLAMTVLTFVRLHVRRSLCLAYNGLGPTELRLVLLGGLLLAGLLGPAPVLTTIGIIGLYDVIGIAFIAACAIGTFAHARIEAKALALSDPARRTQPARSAWKSAQGSRLHRPRIVLAAADGRVLMAPDRGSLDGGMHGEASAVRQ